MLCAIGNQMNILITAQAVKLAWKRATPCAGLDDSHFRGLRHEATRRLTEKLPSLIELAAVPGRSRIYACFMRCYHPLAEAAPTQ